jgi:hypothetical protein
VIFTISDFEQFKELKVNCFSLDELGLPGALVEESQFILAVVETL